MNRRPDKTSLTEGVRSRLGRGGANPRGPQRRVSRRESEARKQRLFYMAMAGAALLVVIILGSGLLYEYQIKPNAVLATVNGHEIKRRDYWKYESVSLYAQATQYQNFANQVTGQQQQQYLSFAAQFEQQRREVWGSTDVNENTLDRMITDQLYLQAAEEMGIEPTDQELENFALNSFVSPDTPLVTPIPSPTMIPERAAAATETAVAALGGTPIAPEATPVTGTPVEGTPEASSVSDTAATPEASPVASATPDMETVIAEAESGFSGFEDAVFGDAHMSRDDYLRLFAKPQLVRTIIDARITDQVPQAGEQIHAEHILVATEDLARQLYDQANGGANFEELAKANSTDPATSATGGDLGWFTHGQMTEPFEAAAFALQPGQISEPVQTDFGWHLIKVVDRQENRPFTDEQYESVVNKAKLDWVDQQREAADIDGDHLLEATETPGTFEAPPNAPTAPPATPLPPTPEATPELIGPELPVASPVTGEATPVASPVIVGTPDASPVASPAA